MSEFDLFDYLKYNNIFYKELPEGLNKERMTLFAEQIKEVGLDKAIMEYNPAHTFNAREFEDYPHDFVHPFPNSLGDKLIVLWLHIDDKEPLEAYKRLFPA